MPKVIETPLRDTAGSGSWFAALALRSAYLTSAPLKRNSKNSSCAETVGAMVLSRRSTVVKSGVGRGWPNRPPPGPAAAAGLGEGDGDGVAPGAGPKGEGTKGPMLAAAFITSRA